MPCNALYFHVPFCLRKCPYCDFYSVPAREDRMDAYTRAAVRAIETAPFPVGELETVYFGGGTPSLLGGERVARLLDAARARFGIAPGAEVTAECNPHSTLERELHRMAEAGVNRISLGMQSADDRQLAALGRPHTAADVAAAVDAARRAGISHISLDLMLATPGQTPADVDRAADFCAALGAEHVSAYLLKIEPGTPFAARHAERDCPDEDGQADAYLHAVAALAARGYEQYEISNFAREGRIARHNLNYWNCGEYLGVGPAAHSFVAGRRRYFPRDLAGFLAAADPWALLVDDGPGGGPEEYMMLRLRLSEGVERAALAARFPGWDAGALWARAGRLPSRLARVDDAAIRLTPEGFLVSNLVIGELLA